MLDKRRLKFILWIIKIYITSLFKKNSLYTKLLRLKKKKIDVYNDLVSYSRLKYPTLNYQSYFKLISSLQDLIFKNEDWFLDLLPEKTFSLPLREWYIIDHCFLENPQSLFQDFIQLTLEFQYYYEILLKSTDTTIHHYRIRKLGSFKKDLDNLIQELSYLILD